MNKFLKTVVFVALVTSFCGMEASAAEVRLRCKVHYGEPVGDADYIYGIDEAKGTVTTDDVTHSVNEKCTNTSGSCVEVFLKDEVFGESTYNDGKFIRRTSISRMDGEYSISDLPKVTGTCVPFKQAF